MANNSFSAISLNRLSIMVKLGVSEEEITTPQEIHVSFRLSTQKPLKACESDSIKDTVCYHMLSDLLKKHCKSRPFRLLESMCYELHGLIKANIPAGIEVWVKVEKCRPPIEGMAGTVSFEYGDIIN